jgi:competence protein ComEA
VALAPESPSPDGTPELHRPAPPRTWGERVELLADATGTTPARILTGGGLVAAAVVAALWLTRPPAPPPEVALPFASSTVALAPATSAEEAEEVLVVHVAGAVVAPGVHELPAGSRVVDAVAAAGGLGPTADGTRINLAAPLTDGERVYVPAVGEVAPPPVAGHGGGAGSGGEAGSGPVDLNTADESALDALPGIGPATAAAIIEHREQIGRFTSVDQLLDVRGIGEAKLEQLRPLVTV